ncbi:MAG: RNA polymerase factor sigma-54 [Bacteroidales bacterium]|nr:RNA polymerase factor sigma-54 [Bacteroidales bacterium]
MSQVRESLSLQQKQALQQRLNPQNVALGRMLEMSVPELEDAIRREIDENPALEVSEQSLPDSDDRGFGESAEQLQLADYSDADDIPDAMRGFRSALQAADNTDAGTLAVEEGHSLIDVVMLGLASECSMDERDEKIARHLAGNLDSNGYLRRPLSVIADDIAIAEGFEPDENRINELFEAIRHLDPPGIGAVDLRDCLLLQIERLPESKERDVADEILRDNFDLFSHRHFDRLLAALDTDKETLGEALDLIRTLNPKPASALDPGVSADRARHITPDASVEYNPEYDRFTITLLGNIPELTIESSFVAGLPENNKETESGSARQRKNAAFAFVRKRYDDANAFIQLLKMRSSTLLSIITAIAGLQKPFFVSGEKADIRPMVLRDVAEITGLDQSVISRATSGKYISTNYGIFPLKLFFNERPDAASDVSSHQILHALGQIIEHEDKHNPLSDRELGDRLEAAGFNIARRTIAKYREKLGIPVARLRKGL